MVTRDAYGDIETAWCPGCGNFNIRQALIKALLDSGLEPHQVLMVSGIGQAAKMPHYLRCNAFNGLHGRGLPAATGARLANPALKIVCESGDGCNYGEGGNHFLAALRRNIDLTLIVHDNQVYGLTKGQASPTSQPGFVTKAQPEGVWSEPFNPLAVAVLHRASLVARGFSGEVDHLAGLIKEALATPGLALVDVFQPCVSFNKENTFAWYKEHTYLLGDEHNPRDWQAALALSAQPGGRFPLGVIYRGDRPGYASHFPMLEKGPLARQAVDQEALSAVMHKFI